MACGIFYEAIQRYQNPPLVNGELVMMVAAMGLATNLIVIYYLKDPFQRNSNDLNLKSALFHVLGDFIASVGNGLMLIFMACGIFYEAVQR